MAAVLMAEQPISWEGLLQTAREDSGDAAGEPGRIGANLGADLPFYSRKNRLLL
jgi:hypothetical protein